MFSTVFVVLSITLVLVSAQDCSQRPPKVNPHDCCPQACPFMMKEYAPVCGGPNPDETGKPMGRPSCDVIKCVLKKNNLISSDDKINRSALKSFVDSKMSAEWKPIVEKAIQTCNTEVDKDTNDDCEPRKYIHCFKDELFKNCPASVFVSTQDCNDFKAFIEKCPRPPMRQ